MPSFQILIVGDDTAGTAAALLLAQQGNSVALIRFDQKPDIRLPEILPVAALPWLHRLGVAEKFVQSHPRASPGVVLFWEDRAQASDEDGVQPFGPGWFIARTWFDEMLLEAAANAGVCVERAVKLSTVPAAPSGFHHVSIRDGSGVQRDFRGSFLISANGQDTSFYPSISGRIKQDRLIAICAAYQSLDERGLLADDRVYVESCPYGWWCSAPNPSGDGFLCGLVTDRDLVSPERRDACFVESLARTTNTAVRIANCLRSHLRTASAGCSIATKLIHHRYLAVGDAAFTLDPLLGHGTMRAVRSGFQGAAACLHYLDGDSEALVRYREDVATDYSNSVRRLRQFYQRETRWQSEPFWQRRLAIT